MQRIRNVPRAMNGSAKNARHSAASQNKKRTIESSRSCIGDAVKERNIRLSRD